MGKKTVGIPRALFYYYHYPLWEFFFRELGFRILLSPPTDKNTVNLGIAKAVDEICYPVKIYYGHLAKLGKENIDYLFLPRLVSVEKRSYICPKFMGLPDMVKAGFTQLPNILEPTFDSSKKTYGMKDGLRQLGNELGFYGKKLEKVINGSLGALADYEESLQLGKTPMEILDGYQQNAKIEKQLIVALLGHGYNIYDPYANMNLIPKLNDLGVQVITPEMLKESTLEKAMKNFPKHMFWTLGRQVVGSALHLETHNKIDGLIHVSSFGCGPDSMVAELVERYIRRNKRKPFLNLIIDEHTGEAGLNTRLEAFIDMINRRKIS